ncbi:copper-binding protein [Limnobacter sp.]|jgi:Cu(I)/Ag(I) efflux system periplasmic protein CusF|uniref:copper-binding protein n=1 Tax=Limnobacter sp. TaxID=2003368 RepID=UPI0027BA8DF5|nr:copper-binding protein [Limnobacter sp.]
MKNTLKLSAITLAFLGASATYAADHTVHVLENQQRMEAEAKAKAKAAAQTEMADGEIRKINKNTGKITVKHGEIKSVEMPPMTMVFGVADKAMLEGLKEGDKVKFNVKQEGSNYTVTEIKKAQ